MKSLPDFLVMPQINTLILLLNMPGKSWYFLLFCLLCHALPVLAQSGIDVNCHFEKDTLEVNYGQTFSNKLYIQNNGNSTVKLIKQRTENTGELIPVPDTIEIQAHTKKAFPVKYFASGKNIQRALQKFGVTFTGTETGRPILFSASFQIRVDVIEQLIMQLLDPVAYIEPQTGLLSFRIKLLNKGYTASAVKVSIQNTAENLRFITLQHQVYLEPGTDTIIRFEAHAIKKNSSRDMVMSVTMENGTGKILANKQVSAIVLNSNKEFISSVRPLPENSIEFMHTTINDNNRQFMLRGNGNIKTSANTQLLYNFNTNYYTATGGYEIRDAYIDFEHHNIALKAGTIAENLEMPVYGRGIKATGIIDKNRVSLYYVNNAYLLYSNLNQRFLSNSPNTWAGTYTHQYSDVSSLDASYIHNHDAAQKLQTDLMSTSGRLRLNKYHIIDFSTGYSWESSKLTLQRKQGYAGGFNYNGYFNSFEISSNNFWSSAYYSGLRRGSIQLNEQISYNLSANSKLAAKFTHQETQPKYIGLNTFSASFNNISTYELVAYLKLSRQFSMSIRPYIQEQRIKNLQFQPDLPGTISADSKRVDIDVRYNLFAAHTLSVNADYGRLFNRQLNTRENSFRLNLNYYGRLLGLNAFMQTGPYYLIDQYYLIYNQYNTNYSISPYINLSLLKHKLTLNLANNLNYSKSSFNSFNSSYTGIAKMKIRGNWELSAQIYYTRYESFDRQQTQLGMAKNFSLAHDNNHKLEVTFFDDSNANGIQDNGEKRANGIRVSVDNNIAQSNDKGMVTYHNTSSGWHQLVIVDSKGWSSNISNNICIKKNMRLSIPLTRNSQLTGRIQPVKEKYQEKAVALEGIRITATDAQNKTYFTLTDEQGYFSLSLPKSQYRLHTDASSDTYTITNASQVVNVTEAQIQPVVFTLIDRSQKVQVRRF